MNSVLGTETGVVVSALSSGQLSAVIPAPRQSQARQRESDGVWRCLVCDAEEYYVYAYVGRAQFPVL